LQAGKIHRGPVQGFGEIGEVVHEEGGKDHTLK
jgi:hypothetical protein